MTEVIFLNKKIKIFFKIFIKLKTKMTCLGSDVFEKFVLFACLVLEWVKLLTINRQCVHSEKALNVYATWLQMTLSC